ncbi:hypothetical protein [Candidatus Tokpelaia sp.]|uniref:hypothetical protein n=1 Tax=Candidatus Tokpelaia sp. TaxID=2233777 RepID=UPI00123B6F86|nr:hypothetical protein [Candidatus Tokpelaia sp.]KAA6405767.1 hypothetical protein DPQ22_02780 [Candidatus Tokpelaia sp.]
MKALARQIAAIHVEKPEIPLNCLTKTMREVAEICGIYTAKQLVYYWPGCRIYVPRKIADDSDFNVIGRDNAQKLCAAFGGATLEVPRNMFSLEGLDYMVHELQALHYSQRDIALALTISQRQVRKIKNGSCRPRRAGRRRQALPGQIEIEDYLQKL